MVASGTGGGLAVTCRAPGRVSWLHGPVGHWRRCHYSGSCFSKPFSRLPNLHCLSFSLKHHKPKSLTNTISHNASQAYHRRARWLIPPEGPPGRAQVDLLCAHLARERLRGSQHRHVCRRRCLDLQLVRRFSYWALNHYSTIEQREPTPPIRLAAIALLATVDTPI